MAIRTLSINIMSYLKGQGFQAVNNQINGLKSSLSSLKSVASNGLFQMAAGYFAVQLKGALKKDTYFVYCLYIFYFFSLL